MFDTTNIIEALSIGLLVGTVAGAVGTLVLYSATAARRRRRDRERLERMKRYLADAQRGRSELDSGYSRTPITYAGEVTFDAAGLERLARAAADPPYSAAGGSFGVKPAPTLTLVDHDN